MWLATDIHQACAKNTELVNTKLFNNEVWTDERKLRLPLIWNLFKVEITLNLNDELIIAS